MTMHHKQKSGVMRYIDRGTRRFAEDTAGVAIVEFAFMFPIMVVIMIMTITFSHMMLIDRKLALTAQAAADLVAQRQSVELDDIEDVQRAAALMMEPYAATFTISIAHVPFDEDSGDPDMALDTAWRAVINGAVPIPTGYAQSVANGSLIVAPTGVATGPLGRPGDALVMLHMSYQYQSIWGTDFSFLDMIRIPGTLTFNKITYARPRLIRQIASDSPMYTVN